MAALKGRCCPCGAPEFIAAPCSVRVRAVEGMFAARAPAPFITYPQRGAGVLARARAPTAGRASGLPWRLVQPAKGSTGGDKPLSRDGRSLNDSCAGFLGRRRRGKHGRTVFGTIGCALCHTPQMQTAPVMNSAVLQNRPVNLFSDLLAHHTGPGLADNIIQGAAGPGEFRTVPLWGVGQRLFFLHDGRTSDLLQAIIQHFSPSSEYYPPSEANAVVQRFLGLSKTDQQAVLDFLRSL
jgi:hypothetical protein